MSKTDGVARILALASLGGAGGGGGTGTNDYNALLNLPQINGIILSGNKTTTDLGIKTSELINDEQFITINDLVAGDHIDITGNVISAVLDTKDIISVAIRQGSLTFDGEKDTFDLPMSNQKYAVFINGLYMTEGIDYTVDRDSMPNTITFDTVYDDFDTCSLVWLDATDLSDVDFATKDDIDNMFGGGN